MKYLNYRIQSWIVNKRLSLLLWMVKKSEKYPKTMIPAFFLLYNKNFHFVTGLVILWYTVHTSVTLWSMS